jgi:hypothetical protein
MQNDAAGSKSRRVVGPGAATICASVAIDACVALIPIDRL